MYELGSWFIWVIDAAVLAVIAFVLILLMFIKRNQYARDSVSKLDAEVWLPTGWDEHYIIKVDDNAKSVTIGNFMYMLDTARRRYGKYPIAPLLGLKWLQVPIRKESWYQDNAEPIRKSYHDVVATSAEIKAITREIQATTAAMQIQEIDARQKELANALANQPNKMIVYLGLLLILIGVIGTAVYLSGELQKALTAWGMG